MFFYPQMTAFSALLAMDANRQKAGRMDWCCCCSITKRPNVRGYPTRNPLWCLHHPPVCELRSTYVPLETAFAVATNSLLEAKKVILVRVVEGIAAFNDRCGIGVRSQYPDTAAPHFFLLLRIKTAFHCAVSCWSMSKRTLANSATNGGRYRIASAW